MPRFKLICDHSCDLDTHVVTHQFNAETYWEVIEQFEMFLKGAGYSFDGSLDLVEHVNLDQATLDELSKHSDHYFDINRNR